MKGLVFTSALLVAILVGAGAGYLAGVSNKTTLNHTVTSTQIVTFTQNFTSISTRFGVGAVLVSFAGSGTIGGQAFTATTSNVEVKFNITATDQVRFVGFSWYVRQFGAAGSTCQGSADRRQGSGADYCLGLTIGMKYEVDVESINCHWQLIAAELH